MTQKNITQGQVAAGDITQAISGVRPASQAEQVIAKEGGETIINNSGETTINNTVNITGVKGDKKINELTENIKQRQRLEDLRYFQGLNKGREDKRRMERIEKSVKRPKNK
jgi:hypothetical protein